MVGLSAISAALTVALFGSVGFGTHGWGQFTWLPLAIIAACYSLFLCNLFILRSPRLQVLLTLVLGGLASPAVAVIFAVYVLVAFGEAILTALSVGVLALAPIILLGALEGRNCDLGKIQRLLRRNGQLRLLPDGREAFDTYREWGLGAEAIVGGGSVAQMAGSRGDRVCDSGDANRGDGRLHQRECDTGYSRPMGYRDRFSGGRLAAASNGDGSIRPACIFAAL